MCKRRAKKRQYELTNRILCACGVGKIVQAQALFMCVDIVQNWFLAQIA